MEVVLGFEPGAGENVATASPMAAGIVKRGLTLSGDRPLLGVPDGSDALRKAVASFPSLVSSVA